MITQQSFGRRFRRKVPLVREIRADMYGVRTFLRVDGEPLKFEIIAEGRIDLGGASIDAIPVPVLDRPSCGAEKLLANTDRGQDDSTRSRDVIDLAFMAASWPGDELSLGLERAVDAYGATVHRALAAALARMGTTPTASAAWRICRSMTRESSDVG